MNYKLNLRVDLKAFFFLFLVAIVMLHANPFQSETIAPMDLLQNYQGWKNTSIDIRTIHPERSDILDSKLPGWLEAKHSLYEGDFPMWDHVDSGGFPQIIFTRSLFTPAFITFALIKDDATGFYFSNLINVLIGLSGMYVFLRLFFTTYASVFGAIIFMFSGFNSAWFFWPHVNTAIWAPWVLFSVYHYLETKKLSYLPLVTFTMLMMNLGGFPIVAVMTYMALAIMILVFLFSKKLALMQNIKILLYLGIFSVLSLLIAIPVIYPLVEMFSWMGGTGYRGGGTIFKLSDFRLFLMTDIYGIPQVERSFYVGILPFIFLISSIYFYLKKPLLIIKFALILFIFTITIAFALIHPDLIRMIPTLNMNPWSRFVFLLGISLALIGAFVFNELILKNENKQWLYVLIIVILAFQIVDQKIFFNRFNAPVPNASFYPKTNSISYLQQHLKPLQYVVADSGYFISGTLGAYGINEWYAHTFHSLKEKKILNKIVNKPFKTPTAAMFKCSQINMDSLYIDYLNIKSILCTSAIEKQIKLWSNDYGKQQAAPPLPKNYLVQSFKINKQIQIDAVNLMMATYGKKHASSDVKLILMKEKEIIADSIVDKNAIFDNQWVKFEFSRPLNLAIGHYAITIQMINTDNAKPLTIWSNVDEKINKLEVNGEKTSLSLKMTLSPSKKETLIPKKFKVINLEQGVHILENTNIKESAYFLNSLDGRIKNDYAFVKTDIISNTDIRVRYTSQEEGWIILPMRSYPGWNVTINGNESKIEKFLGMLPAIKVHGESEIFYSYTPTYSTYLNMLSIFALFVLLYSIIKFKNRVVT